MGSLPPLADGYEKELARLVEQYVKTGLAHLREEDSFRKAPSVIGYVKGNQEPLRSKALSKTHDNRIRKNAYELASALTEVRQVWAYDTQNEQLKPQAVIYSRLPRIWWRQRSCDRALLSAILWAQAVGSSYLFQQWNPDLPGGGDIELIPIDGRDVVPIGPVFSDSIQDWQGVIVRQPVNVSALVAKYPTKRREIEAVAGQSWFEHASGNRRRASQSVFQRLFGSNMPTSNVGNNAVSSTVDLFKIYVKDYSVHTGSEPRVMAPEENYSYTVNPGERLYPRGRCILAVMGAILHDGPNTSWSGMFPLSRLTLLPWPDTLLGLSVLSDVVPLQDALNEWVRGSEDGAAQWIRRGVVADATAMSESKLRALDTRQSGLQVRTNPTAGKGFELLEGPNFPAWWLEWGAFLTQRIDDNMGVRGLQAVLAQAKQIPSRDTLDEIIDSLSPLLKIMSRQIETTLGEVATLYRWNVDQWYTTKRRFQMLGQDGVTVEDVLDYDPGNMIPAGPGDTRSAMERAIDYGKQFVFSVQPNTFLNIAHTTQRLMNLQLFRSNAIDLETLLKSMDLQAVGKIEGETIIDKMVNSRRLGLQPGPPPEVVQAQTALAMLQAQMALGQASVINPAGTAKMMEGGGAAPTSGTGPQGGRPPSGQQLPRLVQKDGGTRNVISESGS